MTTAATTIAPIRTTSMKAAIYARYSSDKQKESSIDDQIRHCTRYCSNHKLEIVDQYIDRAMSGTTHNRPAYKRLQDDARQGLFDTIIIDDLSRLSRDVAEMHMILKRFQLLRIKVIAISDNYDSSVKGHKIQAGVKGLMNDLFIDDLREKILRGMTGKALEGYNVGGRLYGYGKDIIEDPVKKDQFGRPAVKAVKIVINEEEAHWVRKIFAWYAQGKSCKWIVTELNRLKVPSPRGNTWSVTTLTNGKKYKGTLKNERYYGIFTWNRTTWMRDPDTGKRKSFLNDKKDHIIVPIPELRIVDEATEQKVKARQQRTVLQKKSHPKYLFSSLLKCGECGGSYALVRHDSYGCSVNKNHGKHVCSNNTTIKRQLVEQKLLSGIKEQLYSEAAINRFVKETTQLLKHSKRPHDVNEEAKKQIAIIDKEIANIVDAIAQWGMSNASLKEKLQALEQRKKQLTTRLDKQETPQPTPSILPNAVKRYKAMVNNLEHITQERIPEAREIIRSLIGDDITISRHGNHLQALIKKNPIPMLHYPSTQHSPLTTDPKPLPRYLVTFC